MILYTIYKATNKSNGKCYIGFSSDWPHRISTHFHQAIKQLGNSIFHKAIRKYGAEVFEWEPLFQSKDGLYTLKIIEPLLIKDHNSNYKTGHGYNMAIGGEGPLGVRHSAEVNAKKGNKGIKNSFYGKTHSYDSRLIIGQKSKGRVHSKFSKIKMSIVRARKWQILGPDGSSFEIVNLSKFCRDNNLDRGNMVRTSQGKQKTHKGWSCSAMFREKI